jgi:ATP-binding cassette subfamily B protein
MEHPRLDEQTEVWLHLPGPWKRPLETQLREGEELVAFFEPDLDERLRFADGLVVLTNSRVMATWSVGADRNGDRRLWETWPLEPGAALRSRDQGGAGVLELTDERRRLEHWRYTTGRSTAAHRFVQRFNTFRSGARDAAATASVCPSCGALITSYDGQCAACAPESAPQTIPALSRLIGVARPRAGAIFLGFLLTLASTTAGLIPPYLTIPLLDRVLVPYQNGKAVDFSLVVWYLVGLVGMALVAWLLDWARHYRLSWVGERISADLRNKTYAHLQCLSLEFFGGKRTGDLMSRVSSDTDRICNFLSLNMVDFATDTIMIVMVAGILIWIDPVLAAAALAPFPFMVWLIHWVRSKLRRLLRAGGIAWADMTSVLADAIPGIRVVKAFAQERREIQRFGRANDRVLLTADRVNVVWSYFTPMVTLLTASGLLVVWGVGVWRVYEHQVTVGVLTAFLAYIGRFYTRIEDIIRLVPATQRAAASAQRIFEILDRVPSVAEPVRPVHPGRVHGEIELRGVRFKYGTREVLHGIDVQIRSGEMVGLVGPSGAGKSTLINLICRFYDVAEGAILVDGTDIRSFPVEEYRRNIGIVLQDPFLFYGSVADNIAYGKPGATRAQIIAAARAARAHEFILKMPDGYDSMVGERGQSLSGGERQRISIARALLIDPRILILDEATSSVDTQTERQIQAALENLIRGRTTIAIAHRLSTLRRADRLVVIERGNVSEIGNHQDLLARDGAYARLHRAQQELVQKVGI